MRSASTRLLAVMAVGLIFVTAACGSSKSDSSSSATTAGAPTVNAVLAAKVPAKIKDAGVINVATDASYAPNEFFADDGKTIQGMDVDLANALGGVLGIKVNVENVKFDDIIPGLGTRYDLGVSSFTDTKEREQTVDFVTYFTAGTSFLVQTGKNQDLSTLDALCGKHVAVETGTTQADAADTQSTACTTAGKAAIDVQSYPDQNGANLALSSGRADVVLLDSPVAAYQAQQSNGMFEVIGQPIDTAPYGIAVPKGSDFSGLTDAIKGALEQLSSDGAYTAILKKWNVESGAVTTFVINGATS